MKKIYLITFVLIISSFQLFAADSTYVAFAGTEIANGYYTVIDTLNSKPLFSSGVCEIGYFLEDDKKGGGDDEFWILSEGTIASGNELYYAEPDSMNGMEIPIIDDWKVDNGEDPAPVVYFGEYLSSQGQIFNEISVNSGMINNSKPVIIKHNNFKGYGFTGNDGEDFYLNSKALLSNIPSGLTPSVIRIDSVTLSITMNGIATSHNNFDDTTITLSFRNSAFTSGDVASVMKNTTDIIVNFCQEYFVAPSGKDFTNIYDAVNSGGYIYGGGDVINVAEGTITEPAEILIEKGITINGTGAENTIIQVAEPGVTQHRLFNIFRDWDREDDIFEVVIKDVTLRGGDLTPLGYNSEAFGGCIYVSKSNLNVNGVTIEDAKACAGGGVSITEGNLILENSIIRNNAALGGGGLYLDYGSYPEINNCTINGNSASNWNGGGITVRSDLTLTNSTVAFNTSTQSCGGIRCESSSELLITNCTVTGNNANTEGGGIWSNWGEVTISNTILIDNYANSVNDDYYAAYGVVLNDNGYNCVGYQIVSGTPSDWKFSHPNNILYNIKSDGTVSTEWTRNNITLTNQTLGLDSILAENDTNNGTQTVAIFDGSFLIDAGTDQPNGSINIPEQDQRGFNRFENVDIGAYEFMSLYYPENVTAISDGSSVTLTWDVVDGVQSYNIYASVKPYSDFQDLTDFGDFNNDTSWIIPYSDKKLFLYVVSSSDERKSVKIENVTDEMILEYLTKEIVIID